MADSNIEKYLILFYKGEKKQYFELAKRCGYKSLSDMVRELLKAELSRVKGNVL